MTSCPKKAKNYPLFIYKVFQCLHSLHSSQNVKLGVKLFCSIRSYLCPRRKSSALAKNVLRRKKKKLKNPKNKKKNLKKNKMQFTAVFAEDQIPKWLKWLKVRGWIFALNVQWLLSSTWFCKTECHLLKLRQFWTLFGENADKNRKKIGYKNE